MSVNIYPNPALYKITINASSDELEEVSIYNTLGQNVTPNTSVTAENESEIVVDLSNLNSGFYYVKTKNTTSKICKQ